MIQHITKPFKYFFKLEAASGLVLLFAAILALIISNGGLSEIYFSTLEKYITLGTKEFGLKLSVLHWINDVLMAIFFFFVSLEIKREFIQGELSNPKQAMLPIIGAVGGMAVPALFYIVVNYSDSTTLNGWAIPSATDIAFSLGVLSLLGKRVPISLKVFLTALAIIDDLGAIVIIAFFYSGNIETKYLTVDQKLNIGSNYLLPSILKDMGLNTNDISISQEILLNIIFSAALPPRVAHISSNICSVRTIILSSGKYHAAPSDLPLGTIVTLTNGAANSNNQLTKA